MICLTLSSPTLELCLEEIRMNRECIGMAELRLDLLDEDEAENAFRFPSMTDVPVILTLRRKCDGGRCTLSERQRRALLLKALDGDFAYVDIEEDVKKSDVEDKARERGVKIIRSFHDFSGIPDDIYSRIYRLAERGDVAKAAVTPHSISDLMTLFRVADELRDVEKIIVGMGDWGMPLRILYRKTGSMLTFASSGKEVAPGQLSAERLSRLYRADKVDERTAIYGIIGNPVLHTSSPEIHNLGFQAINYNAIYLPFLVARILRYRPIQDSGADVSGEHNEGSEADRRMQYRCACSWNVEGHQYRLLRLPASYPEGYRIRKDKELDRNRCRRCIPGNRMGS